MKAKVNKVTIQIVQADLLALPVAGIVTVTDPNLHVHPRLAARTGPSVPQACALIGWCDVGSAVATDAGDLPVEKIIHAVGPRWGEGSERGKLSAVTLDCLRLAEEHHLKSLALPAISTGSLGYPLENCAKTMLTHIVDFSLGEPKNLRLIIIGLDDLTAYEVFRRELVDQIDELRREGLGKVKT